MENQQNVYGELDMLNNNDKTLENTEVKTPSPLSSAADHSLNEEEERKSVGSESSSEGSSLSDLKRLLQDLPSPNETASLADRVININRCLSRKRNYHIYSATSCIEENDEREEREEQGQLLSSRNFFSEFKTKGARARRRANRSLKSIKSQTMVVSQPNEADTIELKKNSNNNEKLVSSSRVECNSVEQASEQLSPLMGEMSRHYTQQCTSLSEETTATSNLYQYDDIENDSSRSQKNASLLRLCRNLSSENSPKGRIELQSLSPVSLSNVRPTKFGGYRPPSGVILQNLSSGSDPESNYEATSDRVNSVKKNDNLIAITNSINFIGTTSASPILSTRSIQNSNVCSPSSLSNNTLIDLSANGDIGNIITSPISKMNLTVIESNARNSNDRLSLTPLSSSRNVPRDTSFYRLLGIRKGDSDRKDNFGTSVNRPTFLSARNDIHSYKKQPLESPSSLFEMPMNRDIYSKSPESEASQNTNHKLSNSVHSRSNEIAQRKCRNIIHNRGQATKDYQVSSSNEFLNNKNHSAPTMSECYSSTNESLQSSEYTLENLVFENPLEDKFDCSPKDDLQCLELVVSKSLAKCKSNKDIKFPLSERVIHDETKNVSLSSQFKSCMSERDNVASTSRELFTDELKGNVFSRMTAKDNQELPVEFTNRDLDNPCKEYKDVPTLVLNSQEMSQSTSPASKACSGKHLNTDTLVVALSNLSLQQQTADNVLTNTGCDFCDDSETISRSSINNLITDDKPLETVSIKSGENHSRNDASCRSFLSVRSKIPVKIPSNRSKIVSNRFTESEEEIVRSETISIDSSRQTFPNLASLAGRFQLDPEMNDNGSTLDVSSKEQSERFDLKDATDTRQNLNSPSEGVYSRDYLTSLQIQEDSDDQYECKEDRQNQTYRANNGASKQFSIDRSMTEETTMSSNYPDVPKGHEKSDSGTDSPSSESEQIDCSFATSDRYKKHESLSVDGLKSKDSNNFTLRSKSTDYTSSACSRRLENYQERYFRTTYNGKVCENITERPQPNLIEDQIGDGEYQGTCMEESNKLPSEEAPLDSSLEKENVAKNSKVIDSNDRIRFSLERLAAEQFRRNLYADQAKIMQSKTATFLTEKNYESPSFSIACSSSTSKLRHSYDKGRNSPRFRKKSQDRFPFTISEKTSVTSMKFKVSRQMECLNEDSKSPDRNYKLSVHPSITRLASSGIEDTPTDIINYVIYSEKEHDKGRSFGIKEFVRRFSMKLKGSRMRDKIRPDAKATNVIYENRAYRGDSMVDSCSESSLLKEFKVCENSLEKQRAAGSSLNEKSMTNVKESCRQYDCGSLQNQRFNHLDSSREGENEVSETPKDIDNSKLQNDPYAMFFVKSTGDTPKTSRRSLSSEDEEKQDVSVDKKRNRIKFRNSSLTVAPKLSKENVHKKLTKGRKLKDSKRNGNREAGCLCLRFYRMIVPVSFSSVPKYRSRMNHTNNRSSVKKRFNLSLQKKKK